jgi:hypothetical protein
MGGGTIPGGETAAVEDARTLIGETMIVWLTIFYHTK